MGIIPHKESLQIDRDIRYLFAREEGTVTENDLIDLLRRYNLRDGLEMLGRWSFAVFESKSEFFGGAGHKDEATGAFVTQFTLAYLANLLLISGANDFKSKKLSENKDNVLALCRIYAKLVDSFYSDNDVNSFIIRSHSEQLEYQFEVVDILSRSLIIFTDITNDITPCKIRRLPEIFFEDTGVSLRDYYYITFAIMSSAFYSDSSSKGLFRKLSIVSGDFSSSPHIQEILNEEQIDKCLKILKIDYKNFARLDNQMNHNIDMKHTKTRFNPLDRFPIIETKQDVPDLFIIPNLMLFLRSAYKGLYWWFHNYFERTNNHRDFRAYFGLLFQEYVGRILSAIYGAENVKGEIHYGKDSNKFIDWWVEADNTIYLFEAKAYQFALESKTTGGKEQVIKNEMKKTAEAIAQVYARCKDIDRFDELKHFRNRKIVPVIVFWDMPFASKLPDGSWLENYIRELEVRKGLVGLSKFHVNLLKIEELELYERAKDSIDLSAIFDEIENVRGSLFKSIIKEHITNPSRNNYLDNVYEEFFSNYGLSNIEGD